MSKHPTTWDQCTDLSTKEGIRQAISRRQRASVNARKEDPTIRIFRIDPKVLKENAEAGTRVLDRMSLRSYSQSR